MDHRDGEPSERSGRTPDEFAVPDGYTAAEEFPAAGDFPGPGAFATAGGSAAPGAFASSGDFAERVGFPERDDFRERVEYAADDGFTELDRPAPRGGFAGSDGFTEPDRPAASGGLSGLSGSDGFTALDRPAPRGGFADQDGGFPAPQDAFSAGDGSSEGLGGGPGDASGGPLGASPAASPGVSPGGAGVTGGAAADASGDAAGDRPALPVRPELPVRGATPRSTGFSSFDAFSGSGVSGGSAGSGSGADAFSGAGPGIGTGSGSFPGSGSGTVPGAFPGSGSGSGTGSGSGGFPAQVGGLPAPGPLPARLDGTGSFDAFSTSRPQAPASSRVTAFGVPAPAGPVPSADGTSSFDGTVQLPRVPRAGRDPLAIASSESATPGSGSARIQRLITADYLLTVNPVDGTEMTACPPDERPIPVRRTREERDAHTAAARPTPPPGPPAPELPLLERDEERERLIRLLARGRSIRVTGPSGAGRTALLESVANACGDLAPEGVLWLSGYRRTSADLLQDLYATVYAGSGYRPGQAEVAFLLHEVGAVVVIDDLEFGGAGLEELLAAAPECAFLMSATPDVAAPASDSMIDEVFLSGLTRVACLDLLQLVAGRPLEEDETAWAADLWFESEGLPLRFVQAGALLRQRDALRQPPEPDWEDSVWEAGSPAEPAAAPIPDLAGFEIPGAPGADATAGQDAVPDGAGAGPLEIPAAAGSVPVPPPSKRLSAAEVPLPSLAESAAPAELLASRLSESAREALAFAVALDGECPHPSHLPALVGDTHGDAALGELTSVGLAVPVAAHFRLAAGVVQQLAEPLAAEGELSDVQAHTAALHYAWWTGHPSVSPQRAATESEAIIAAMTACRDSGHASAAVLLARTVAPAFAAALAWGAWERTLRVGQEAARLSGEVAEEAYFHHELGVLALSNGNTDRARAELEASIALRAALADRQGTLVGRRTLALVNDRAGTPVSGIELLDLPPTAAPEPVVVPPPPDHGRHAAAAMPLTVISKRPPAHAAGGGGAGASNGRRIPVVGSRRNLLAVGTGVVLAVVVGTFVTLGATSGSGGKSGPNQVKPIETAQQVAPDDTESAPANADTSKPSTKPSATPSSATPSGTATTVGSTGVAPPPETPSSDGTTTAPATTEPAPGGGAPTFGPTHTPPPHTVKPTPSHTVKTTPPTKAPPTTPPATPTPDPTTTPPDATVGGAGDPP